MLEETIYSSKHRKVFFLSRRLSL